MPREARRASSALFLSPAAVLVPRGTVRPLGSTLFCSSCPFFGYKVKVRFTVWARISVGSVQFRFVRSSSLSSFAKFRRIRRFVRRVLLPLDLTKPSFPGHSGPYCFCLAVWVLLSWWLGGQVRGLVGCYNLGSFLVDSTSVDSFWLSSLRIVLPLELEIRFG